MMLQQDPCLSQHKWQRFRGRHCAEFGHCHAMFTESLHTFKQVYALSLHGKLSRVSTVYSSIRPDQATPVNSVPDEKC